jgi:[protein-PII] uridylyltransferase
MCTLREQITVVEISGLIGYIRRMALQIKSFLDEQRSAIERAHKEGAESFGTCAALTAMMDEVLRQAFTELPDGAAGQISVLALGGYGRGELFPHSDVDVMVLCDAGAQKSSVGEIATAFLHLLWDAGLDVGHSVRTVDEALALRGNTLDAWTSLLESRFICGSAPLAQQFFASMKQQIGGRPDLWLIDGIFADAQSRLTRFGSSVKLLEPNVKKSAGGLRDIHAAFWLHRGVDPAYFTPLDGSPATKVFLDQLHDRSVLPDDTYEGAVDALRFLFRVRQEMHFLRGGAHDTLEYALQLKVAEGMGYKGKTDLRSVEVFMHDYYLHARSVHSLYERLGQKFREYLDHGREGHASGRSLGNGFILRNDALALDAGVQMLDDPRRIFEAFALSAEQEVPLDFSLRAVIERSSGCIGPEMPGREECTAAFRRILNSHSVARVLHDMNDLNVLGRFIPEFGELVAFFQHNVYHYFTADEHTLIAIANAEKLREEEGFLHEVFRNLRRKDLLYMAVLLHDIAKPRGVADHEITGVGMSQVILRRLGMEDLFPEVGFLVRNHLVMEQIAFRRNIHDPETLKEFAARFEKPHYLDYLYLLTYADLSAVNPGVWTEWKATMLQELYQRTAEVLVRDLHGEQVDLFHRDRREKVQERLMRVLAADLPPSDVESHLHAMQNDSYFSLFSEEEIREHIVRGARREAVSAMCVNTGGFTEVTVVARDAPYALSKFCAVLSANDANILDANIFTRDDGIIIDRFRVADAGSRRELGSTVCRKIADDLKLVMEGTLDVGHLFREHHRRWKRRPGQPANPSVRTDVQFEDNPRFTIIEVYAPDSVGFLYRITGTISRLGLNINFAKIATRVDGIVDSFYVLDRDGAPVTDPHRREEIREKILRTIRELSGQALAS